MEKILCAAIWVDDGVGTYVRQPENITKGFVVAGRRHDNCFTTWSMLSGVRRERGGTDVTEGFLTSLDRFVSREEGLVIALRENQVTIPEKVRGERLYSEALY